MKNLFKSAVLKLTLVYTLILAIICIGFSVAFYAATNQQLDRPVSIRIGGAVRRPFVTEPDFQAIIRERDNEMRANLIALLVIIDTSVLLAGAIASYFLARWTLQPIHKMTEQQANFISDASHELRTPLAAIAMENEIALRNYSCLSKIELAEILKSNLEETDKLQSLTNRLLKLSQNEPLKLSEIDLTASVETAIRNLSAVARAKHIIVKHHIKPIKIISNTAALTEILTILLENAIKYSPAKSTVTVNFQHGKISVHDQGPGIAKADLPHIFNRFYRAEKSRTSHGYGLGLPLAKQLASQLHLKITVESNPAHGATFFIEQFSKPSA